MKKLLILLFLGSVVKSHSQCDERIVWAPSINKMSHTSLGISAEIAYISKFGISAGTSLAVSSDVDYFMEKIDGKEVWVKKTINLPHHTFWIEGFYKIVWEDYSYAINIVGGGLYDTKKEFAGYIGLNIRVPMYNKALFIQPTYRTDKIFAIRGGIYFDL